MMNGKVTAFGFRHSLTDVDREVTPEGYSLAARQGQQLKLILPWYRVRMLGKTKHVRTGQSLAALIAPYGELPEIPQCGVIQLNELCSDNITAAHDATPKDLMAKMGKFRAMMSVHGRETMKKLAIEARDGVKDILFHLNYANPEVMETGIFVAHSPGLELAVWAVKDFPDDLHKELATLREMDGVEFEMDSEFNITVLCKLCAPKL
jgi:hypothetical protein